MILKIIKSVCGALLTALGIWFAVTGNDMACINLSVLLFFYPVLNMVGDWIVRLFQKGLPNQSRQGPGSTALLHTVCFMAAACLLRYAVTGYVLAHPDELGETVQLLELEAIDSSVGVRLVDAALRAIRSIGVLEDYTTFITALKAVWGVAYPANEFGRMVIMSYATVLNIAIPIAGSTLILGMFAQIFPRFLLWLKYRNPFRREKCYFSGLNPQSVALAKSILLTSKAEGKWIMPLLVFTDAYVDDESEQSYELVMEAKRLGAICLRDDLAHVLKTSYGERKYFLMEEEEYANLPALMGLTEAKNVPYLKNAAVYLFVQSDLYVRLEQNIRTQLMDKEVLGKKALSKEELPSLIPVNAHRNLVNNLMTDLPLYEPLVGTDKKSLTVTIFGNGSIGTEAFLSAYWFGQMMTCHTDRLGDERLEECPLTIHVVSQDEEAAFWSKIDAINPEVRCTTKERDPILAWRDGAFNNPYCTVKYHKADAKTGLLVADKKQPDAPSACDCALYQNAPEWLDTDYAIVALGSDADNIAVANKLRAHIGKTHLEGQGASRNTVIAYVVYNSELCAALNTRSDVEYGVYMHAFGDLEQVYSMDNVFMSKSLLLAEETHKAYHGRNDGALAERKARQKVPPTSYEHLADLARAMHLNYKIFSLGWMKASLFTTHREKRNEAVQQARALYRRVAVVGNMNNPDLHTPLPKPLVADSAVDYTAILLDAEDQSKWEDLCRKRHVLAWLEHRRWCAYTRTTGFRYTTAVEKYYAVEKSHKNMSLKLHPCLAEAHPPHAVSQPTYVCWNLPVAAEDERLQIVLREALTEEQLWAENPDIDRVEMHHLPRWQAARAAWHHWAEQAGAALARQDYTPQNRLDFKELFSRLFALESEIARTAPCKKYDYFIGEFPPFVLASDCRDILWKHMHISADKWEKICASWESRGAFLCQTEKGEEWVVPEDCVVEFLRRRYALTLKAEGTEMPKPFAFAFRKMWYAPDTWCNRRRVKRLKERRTILREQALVARLKEEHAEKEKVKTAVCAEEA